MEYISIIISIVAVLAALGTVIAQVSNNRKNASAVFANLWFELDQMFIEHPQMHKYFYTHKTTIQEQKEVTPVDKKNTEEFELALCIAERIVDVFQYAELFKDALNKDDKKSYERFKERMFSSDFMKNTVKPIWENNGSEWII